MKTLDELYTDISNSINRGSIYSLKALLSSSNDIDITQDQCDFFYFPIERNQPEIVRLLLDYFFQTQLSKYSKDSDDYITLINTLTESLYDWTTEYGCSEEMKNVLSLHQIKLDDYLNLEGSTNDTSSIKDKFEAKVVGSDNTKDSDSSEKEWTFELLSDNSGSHEQKNDKLMGEYLDSDHSTEHHSD